MTDIHNYHYREDGLKLWECIKEYVSEIVELFYHTDGDVLVDYELQQWVGEIYG